MILNEIEKKILKVLKCKKKISVEDLTEILSIYELFHFIVLKDEFKEIAVVNVGLQQEIIFNDGKGKELKCPYFEIEKKGC